tara:strand:+ start:135 stop:659 length:525 start_codon:yes stop_codon:yes gene_type:complete
MSEEKVQENVQESLDIKTESKPESADNGLLQEVMAKKATIKELQAKLSEYETANEKARQKQLAEDGKKDELIAELNSKVEHLNGEYTRLSKYEDDEKTNLIASIAADETEAETLSKESLSTLRLLKNKIASKPSEAPPARGSVGNQPPPSDWTKMDERQRRKNWGDILKSYKKN